MIVEDQSAAIACLADPATHGGEAVERIDTHGAVVFLAGHQADFITGQTIYVDAGLWSEAKWPY